MSREFDIVVYGATGLTGGLIVDGLIAHSQKKLSVLLAGRNAERLAAAARQRNLPWFASPLDDAARLRDLAGRARVLINTAAPFVDSALPLLDACVSMDTHYIDCSGEFQSVRPMARDKYASQKKIYITPAVGLVGAGSDILVKLIGEKQAAGGEIHVCYTAGPSLARGSVASLLANGMLESRVLRADSRLREVEVPPGRYERAFDVALSADLSVRLVGSAVALPDLIFLKRRGLPATAYFEMTSWQRHLLFAQGLSHLPESRRYLDAVSRMVPGLLPAKMDTGLDSSRQGRQGVALELLDGFGRGSRASLSTTDAHAFTARAVVLTAVAVLSANGDEKGLRQPSTWLSFRNCQELAKLFCPNTYVSPPQEFGFVRQ
jgi:short subunit dehydrogenase-like uncharacterized protein